MKKQIIIIACALFALAGSAQTAFESAYAPFALGELKPEGWLKDWARRAANGLTKNIGEDFTEFVRGWQDANQGGWWHYEQTGYYIDGVTRLGFLLNDPYLINRSREEMEAVMQRQHPNGYIHSNTPEYVEGWGTPQADYGLYWSEGIFARAAFAYYTATRDERVLSMLKRVYADFPLFKYNTQGKYPFNGGDLDDMRRLSGLETMFELTRITGDSKYASRALQVLKNYEPAYIEHWARHKNFMRTAICHGVSYNEASKIPAIGYIWGGNKEYLAASVNSYEFLQENFMLPCGSNSSNEFLQGKAAFEPTESCDVTDFMWSNIWMARATGDRRYGDRIERNAFNALPGALNPSFTQCVYAQPTNRLPQFSINNTTQGLYYREMHWPTCCPANLQRALPNYIANMAMLNGRGELMWLTYGPAHLQTRDGRYDIQLQTEYPFRDRLTFIIHQAPANQVLRLRIPSWCEQASLTLNGKAAKARIEDGFFVIASKWKSGDSLVLTLPMKPVMADEYERFPLINGQIAPVWNMFHGHNGGMQYEGFTNGGHYATVSYGPLLFAMPMQRGNNDAYDNNIGPATEFRYALTPHSLDQATVELKDMTLPFAWHYLQSPVVIHAKGSLVDWAPDKGDPKLPTTPPATLKPDLDIKLVPYGVLAYRLAMFPFVEE